MKLNWMVNRTPRGGVRSVEPGSAGVPPAGVMLSFIRVHPVKNSHCFHSCSFVPIRSHSCLKKIIFHKPHRSSIGFSAPLERLKKCCSHFGARIFGVWRGFGEGAGLKNPVTEPKRSQNPKRPLSSDTFPNGYNIFENALTEPPPSSAILPIGVNSKPALLLTNVYNWTWHRRA
jgi:hypothetical protein